MIGFSKDLTYTATYSQLDWPDRYDSIIAVSWVGFSRSVLPPRRHDTRGQLTTFFRLR